MKKFLTLILIACLAGFASCNVEGKLKSLVSLDGSTWEGTYSEAGHSATVTLNFSVDTYEATYVSGNEKATDKGTYSYLASVLTMTSSTATGTRKNISGTRSGNTLTLTADGIKLVLTEK